MSEKQAYTQETWKGSMKGSQLRKSLKEKHLRFFIYLFIVFAALLFLNISITFWLVKNNVIKSPVNISSSLNYPVLKSSYLPQVSAKGALIMDSKTKAILYSKNPNLRFSSASTTKIMTAVVALDYFKPTDVLTVKQVYKEGSILGTYTEEKFTLENLLYAMLLPSANDAAVAVAQNYPGGETAFVAKMNEKAKLYSLNDTNYGDPVGLFDKQNFTTPFDLARLSSFALEYKEFAKIVSTKYKIITDISASNIYKIENLNELLGEDGVTGVKTGFTEEAGQVLVTAKLENKNTIIYVVMGSIDRFADTRNLINLTSGNLTYLTIRQ